MKRRVVVTGLGVVTSLSCKVDDLWKRVLAGESGIHRLRILDPTPFLVWPEYFTSKSLDSYPWTAGRCLIGVHGRVGGPLEEADIEAINVMIKGRVTGNVVAQDHLVIHASGVMNGDLYARYIDIKEGSSFEGRSHMIKNNKP